MDTGDSKKNDEKPGQMPEIVAPEIPFPFDGARNRGRSRVRYKISSKYSGSRQGSRREFHRADSFTATRGNVSYTAKEKRHLVQGRWGKESGLKQSLSKTVEDEWGTTRIKKAKTYSSSTIQGSSVTESRSVERVEDGVKRKAKAAVTHAGKGIFKTETISGSYSTERTEEGITTQEEKAFEKNKSLWGMKSATSRTHTIRREIGDKTITDEFEKSSSSSFFLKDRTSRHTHSVSTESEIRGGTQTVSDSVTRSSSKLGGETKTFEHAVKTKKGGVVSTETSSHSFNRNVLSAEYTFEKSKVKTMVGGLKVGSRSSVSVSSSIPFIQKMIQKHAEKKISQGTTTAKPAKALPAPKPPAVSPSASQDK
ncbi:MAG: hypothetical protein MI863_11010 [Desulfobacterales bacterium]|nr:hypothetical protein [Desulfobacterales bacterium]